MNPLCTILVLAILGSMAVPASALEPKDVFLIVNKNVDESGEIANYYCVKRGVPRENIIALDLPKGEDVSRKDYDSKLAGPLREQLRDRRDAVKVLLTIYGVPLRVGRQEPNAFERQELTRVRKDLEPFQKELKEVQERLKKAQEASKADPKSPAAAELKDLEKERESLQKKVNPRELIVRKLEYAESEASVDSELALLWVEKYDLRRWQMNTRYFRTPENIRKTQPYPVLTCRLDGPGVELIKRIIDTSIAVEAKGLTGKVYVDARGIGYNPKEDPGLGYGGYDESMREMARLLDREAKLPVTLDNKAELFAPASCPDCALYCGWYSLANYVPCCKFVPGAVAFHLASSEAVTLRDDKCKLWCGNLLKDGVVATLGPVAEPYTIGFPKPAEFFGLLVSGEYTLVECYWRTQLLTSWMTVLVGDPLYNPFGKTPKLKSDQVKPSPIGGQFNLFTR